MKTRPRHTQSPMKHACHPGVEPCEGRILLSSGLNTFAQFDGELTTPGQKESIPLQIRPDDFTMPALEPGDLPVPVGVPTNGFILLGFAMRATDQSLLDPDVVKLTPNDNAYIHGGGAQKPDTAGSTTSLTLARVSIGTYQIGASSERKTIGPYQLDVFLAGDANADFQVNQQDLDLIKSLSGTKSKDLKYKVDADVDRNGVINGGDVQWAGRNLGAATTLRLEVTPLSEQSSPGVLNLEGVSETAFNSTSATVRFRISGTTFSADPADVQVYRNGQLVQASKVTKTSESVSMDAVLTEGRNDLVLLSADAQGLPLIQSVTLWAGPYTLNATIVDENGVVTDPVSVTVSLTDDQQVTFQATTIDGHVSIPNLPDRTFLLRATASGNRVASLGTTGGAGHVKLTLIGFDPASEIKNDDFSQGTMGWNIGSAPVQIVPHTEGITGQFALMATASASVLPAATGNRGSSTPVLLPPTGVTDKKPPALTTSTFIAAAATDNDLLLNTSGEGEQKISRTFNTAPGTTSVRVRYRFITSEVPGGYFGSQYNDYYSVSIRSQQGGGSAGESNSMNGLGIASFDFTSGATTWREATLTVNSAGDIIQVDVGVANVGDGAYDSQVVIDFIEQENFEITGNLEVACPNEEVVFQVEGTPSGTVTWSTDGTPATGTGNEFRTRFTNHGEYTVTATLTTNSGSTSTATATVTIDELSGAQWVQRFLPDTTTAGLTGTFRTAAENFISALEAAGANVSAITTYRPAERSHLMHYAYRIARENLDPATVPVMDGVDICWVHRDANGAVNLAASRAAAEAMVVGYGIQYAPAINTRHTVRLAIDMTITWTGDLTITDGNEVEQTITSTPRTGAGNVALHAIGASYGVIKLVGDPPHWSSDGH